SVSNTRQPRPAARGERAFSCGHDTVQFAPMVTILAFAAIMAQAPAPAAPAPPKPPSRATAVEHIKVHGKSLEGNLEGDSPDRDVTVYLPPSYAADKSRRYPGVYLLHG